MSEFLETTIDKFTFKVAVGRLYTNTHLWVLWQQGLVRVGLSDYLQQTSGDVAFADTKPAGTTLALADEFAAIETMKTNLSLPSPVSGVIIAANPRLGDEPELVNQDPYGEGWLVLVAASNWEKDKAELLDAAAYLAMVQAEAETEVKKL